jgi:hypothetical protein
MKMFRLFAGVAVAASLSFPMPAQQAPSGFHSVGCYKLKADKTNTEFRQWAADELHKVAQARVDLGVLSTYYLLRALMPVGTSADCDYLIVAIYPGAPPEPLGPEQITTALKKAGMSITAQEYTDHRSALATLVSNNMYRNLDSAGAAKKGGVLSVAYMKAADVQAWIDFEKKVWKPLAEQMIKDGVQSGWSLNVRAFGQDSQLPYQGVTVDVYPSWDAVWKEDSQFMDRFKKVHPDMQVDPTFEKMEKTRTMVKQELYAIDDMISAEK